MFDFLGEKRYTYLSVAIALSAIIVIAYSSPRTAVNFVDSETAYYYGMMPIVKNGLKAPSTAVFLPYKNIVKNKIDNYTWEFNGYVDSHNSFGAMLRTKFICIVNYNPETDRWQKVNLLFGD